MLVAALGVAGAQCGKAPEEQAAESMFEFGGDNVMLTCSPGGATYASPLENSIDIGGKSEGLDKGLSIHVYSHKDKFSVSYISNRATGVPFYLWINSSSNGNEYIGPDFYIYDDYSYPTDTVIDTRSEFRTWYSAIGKCLVVNFWPNSMCRNHGYSLYNENYEIDGGTRIGIHKSYDEYGNLTYAVDADTLDFFDRIE